MIYIFIDLSSNAGITIFENIGNNFKLIDVKVVSSKKINDGFNQYERWRKYSKDLKEALEEYSQPNIIIEFSTFRAILNQAAVVSLSFSQCIAQLVFGNNIKDYVNGTVWKKYFSFKRKDVKKAVKEYIENYYQEETKILKNEHLRDSFLMGIYYLEDKKGLKYEQRK